MSFSTPHVSVQWALRFEFLTTPRNVDWTRYDYIEYLLNVLLLDQNVQILCSIYFE